MSKPLRCLTVALNDIPEGYRITLGYLTYHSGKLYNQALYLLKNKLAKVNMFNLYNKLNSLVHLKALQSRSAQIILDELVIAYKNWFEYLKNPKEFKGQEIKPPNFRPKRKPHRTIIYDKTGFKIIGTKIRLSLSKELRKVNNFVQQLSKYDEIWFYHNPWCFHPLYKKMVDEMRKKGIKVKLFTHLSKIW